MSATAACLSLDGNLFVPHSLTSGMQHNIHQYLVAPYECCHMMFNLHLPGRQHWLLHTFPFTQSWENPCSLDTFLNDIIKMISEKSDKVSSRCIWILYCVQLRGFSPLFPPGARAARAVLPTHDCFVLLVGNELIAYAFLIPFYLYYNWAENISDPFVGLNWHRYMCKCMHIISSTFWQVKAAFFVSLIVVNDETILVQNEERAEEAGLMNRSWSTKTRVFSINIQWRH